METREAIRDFYNRIIGYICTDSWTKQQTGRDFYNRIVGTWSPRDNLTRDFYGRVVAKGNTLPALIQAENDKQTKK